MGKSTVAARWRQTGLPVVDADQLSRLVVEPGSEGLAQLVKFFGAQILTPEGRLDRPALAEQVFPSADARGVLESIVHPRVREEAERQFAALAARGEPLCCYEVPLLFEVGLERGLQPIVVVKTDRATQLSRLAQRDPSTVALARRKIDAQMPISTKVSRADHVIDNSGGLTQTYRQADAVLQKIRGFLGITAPRRGPQP